MAMPAHLAGHAITVVLPEFMKLGDIVPGSKEAWWFLSFLGTHPDAQGRGVGGALLSAKMDAVEGPFALSTGTDKNLRWYGKRGFGKRGSIRAPLYDGWVWEEWYMTSPGDAVMKKKSWE
jgi:GNAT superfamily N-acetyltransferase